MAVTKFRTDIIDSTLASLIGQAVIMFVKTFKIVVIVLICNFIISSIIVSLLILKISVRTKDKYINYQ